MTEFQSHVSQDDKTFQHNAESMLAQASDLRNVIKKIQKGGGEKALARHREHGKLLPRDRIELLLDPGSDFLELSALAGYELYEDVIS